MTTLRVSEGNLILDGEQGSTIFNWEHRLFFTTVLGYKIDEKNNSYEYEDKTQIFDIIKETVHYLSEISEDLDCDKEVSEILIDIRTQDELYVSALESGHEAKEPIDQAILPQDLIRQLHPFQLQAVNHLLSVKHGANFSVPGSGKTTTIYAAYELLRQEGIVEKLLVIGPRSCFFPWEDEYKACFGKSPKSGRLTGPKMSRESVYLQSKDFDLFLCTYQTASNDIKEIIGLCKKYNLFVVLDELQH